MITLLQEYLRIDTSFPNPRYDEAIALFVREAKENNISYQVLDLSSGLKALLLTLEGTAGTQLPALLLNHHMDVVPITQRSEWICDPFGGEIIDGAIYGRGAQDMKGVGVGHFSALCRLVKEGLRPKRTIHWVMLPEEERGGYEGAGCFVTHPIFKKLNIGYSIDEGVSSGSPDFLNIKVSERKPIHVLFVSKGGTAHGSRLGVQNAAHELILFLTHLATYQKEQQKRLASEPAGLLLSLNVTTLQAGVVQDGVPAYNVVSDSAQATVDVRVPPQMTLQEGQEKLDEFIADFPHISYVVESTVPERSYCPEFRNEFYAVLERAINKEGLAAHPFHAEESSDSRFYAEKGVRWFGLTPYTIKENLHGVNECITLKDFELGCEIFYSILKDFCF